MRRREFLALPLLAAGLPVQGQTRRKQLLVIGDEKGYRHTAITHAMATIHEMGRQSGLWDTHIRTDTEALTKKKLEYNARNLDDYDAVLFYTGGNLAMDAEQRADFLKFVRDDGKGFIGVHSAAITWTKWPEFVEMVGGTFDEHPWGTFAAPIVVEDPKFPGMSGWPASFTLPDEIYQMKEFSREKCRVLLRLDASRLDLSGSRVHRADRDFAVAWAKTYGKGRVFYSTLGHVEENWDRPDMRQMYFEAIRWSLGLVEADITPRPLGLRFGIGAYTYHGLSTDAMVAEMVRLGVREMEMSRGEFMTFQHPKLELFETFRRKIDAAGIRCVSYYAPTIKTAQDLDDAVRFAKALGASNISGDPEGGEILKAVDERMQREGMTFGIHNHYFPKRKFTYETPEDLLRAIEGRSRAMGVTLDIGHIVSCGHDPVEAVRKLGPVLKMVHLKDIQAPGGEVNVPLGEGQCRVREVLAELKKVQYQGVVAFEYEKEGDVREDVGRQMAWLGRQ